MIVDLVSPWYAAIEAPDSLARQLVFRERHASLLETLRRQHTPLADELPLAQDAMLLREFARRASDPVQHDNLRQALSTCAEFGADCCKSIILIAGDGTGDAAEPILSPECGTVLFVDRAQDDRQLIAALATCAAALTRWCAPDSPSVIRRIDHRPWDRWQVATTVPLREWLYAAGLGLHLAHQLLPDLNAPELLGVSPAAFARLRQRETRLHALLAQDLDRAGIASWVRWLAPDVPAGSRAAGGTVVPPAAGRYLAWRMMADRVERTGLRAAIRSEA